MKPVSYLENFPSTPALIARKYEAPVISLKKDAGDFKIEIEQRPLSVRITNKQGRLIQKLIFNDDESLAFQLNNESN